MGIVWNFLWVHYHKDWVDVGTIVFAFLYVGSRVARNWPIRPATSTIARSAMDGAAVFPLLLLTLAVFSRHAVEGLLEASRPTLSLAGFFALLSVLSDERSDKA